jgi:hypothetical protein
MATVNLMGASQGCENTRNKKKRSEGKREGGKKGGKGKKYRLS